MKILYFFPIFVGHFASWIRIRIRIQQLKLMRIHAYPDPDQKPWMEVPVTAFKGIQSWDL